MFDGLFNAAGNIASSLIQLASNRDVAGLNAAASRELAELQNRYNIDMWNMNNEYNTPANQLQRIVAAGLNPNLAYGNISTGNSSRPPEAVVGSYHQEPTNFNGMFNGIGSIFSDIMNFARFQEELNGKRISNARDALKLLDAEAYLNAKALYKKDSLWDGTTQLIRGADVARDFNHKYYNSGLAPLDYYADKLNADLGFRKNQSSLTAGKLTYQNLINSWFKTDRIFNMVNGAAKTILSSIPFGRMLGGGNPTRYFESNRKWKPLKENTWDKTWPMF